MSTYYALICEDCKEKVDGASRTAGGYSALVEGPACLIPFIITHAGCHVEIISEHDERWCSDDYFEWTKNNVKEAIVLAQEAGRWGKHDTWTIRDEDHKGRSEVAEAELDRMVAVAKTYQNEVAYWKTRYEKTRAVLKSLRAPQDCKHLILRRKRND